MNNKTSDENVANIEELIQEYKTYNDLDGIQDLRPYIEVLEHILAELEQKDKRIQEMEEVDIANRKVIVEQCDYMQNNSIPKQVVIEALENIEDYFERLNGPDEDIDYIRQVKKELLEGEK